MIIGMFSDRVRNTFLWMKSSKRKTNRVSVPPLAVVRETRVRGFRTAVWHTFYSAPSSPRFNSNALRANAHPSTGLFFVPLVRRYRLTRSRPGEHGARYLCRRRTRTLALYPPTHVHDTSRGIYLRYGLQYFRSTGPGRDKNTEKRCVSGMAGRGEGAGRGVGNIQPKMPSYESGGDGGGGVYRRT